MERPIFTPDQKLLALSWKQPYAELMLHGKYETRTWNANYRGWVLICASLKSYYTEQLTRMGKYLSIKNPNYEGRAIAIGRLIDCRPMKPEDEDKAFVLYSPDRFVHIYDPVIPIEPFPWKGKQGWSIVPNWVKNNITLTIQQKNEKSTI